MDKKENFGLTICQKTKKCTHVEVQLKLQAGSGKFNMNGSKTDLKTEKNSIHDCLVSSTCSKNLDCTVK